MFSRLATVLFLLFACLAAPLAARADTEADQASKLIDQIAPSIVTVRIVVKITVKQEGQSRTRESRVVSEGVVVSPDGLIMMSSAPVSTDIVKQMLGGGDDDSTFDFTIEPTDFKVVIGNEEKEYSAFLAATDVKTTLAFIKITDLGDRKLTALDLSTSASPNIGDTVLAISRLSKGYDYAPIYSSTRVNGQMSKPLPSWVLGGDIMSIGLPVFSLTGIPVGVMTLAAATADTDDRDSSSPMDMMEHFEGSASSPIGYVMLPIPTITEVITEAEKQAATLTPPPPAPATTTPPAASTAPAPAKPAPAVNP